MTAFSRNFQSVIRAHLVETKAQDQVIPPNVKRKKRAAVSWCDKGASICDMLEYAKLRPVDEWAQATFSF